MPTPSVLYKMKGAHCPERWVFIRLVPQAGFGSVPVEQLRSKDAAFAFCTDCNCKVDYSSGSTTAVKKHMQRFHMEVLLKAKQAKEEANALKAKRQLENCYDMVPVTSKRQPVAITSDQQDYSNGLAAKWVAQSMRPLTVVQDPGLFEWIRFLTEDLGGIIVGIPGVTQLRDDVGRVAAELRASLKARIRISCEYFCITTDIWTSRKAQSYMALTLHYLEEDFTMCNWTLEVEIFPGMHTGVAIACGLKTMMERWGLRSKMCTMLVRDGASNAVLGSNILGVKNMSCIAHSLHLVLGGALAKAKSSPTSSVTEEPAETHDGVDEPVPAFVSSASDNNEIPQASPLEQHASLAAIDEFVDSSPSENGAAKDALSQVRSIVQRFRALSTYFHKSAKATNRLDEIQVKVWKRSALHLITDCPTRWNSCYEMLTRLIELEAPLGDFFARLDKPDGKKEFKELATSFQHPRSGLPLTV